MTAGFWNNHVHLLAPPVLQADERPAAAVTQALQDMFTRWGLTTVFDLGSVASNTTAPGGSDALCAG